MNHPIFQRRLGTRVRWVRRDGDVTPPLNAVQIGLGAGAALQLAHRDPFRTDEAHAIHRHQPRALPRAAGRSISGGRVGRPVLRLVIAFDGERNQHLGEQRGQRQRLSRNRAKRAPRAAGLCGSVPSMAARETRPLRLLGDGIQKIRNRRIIAEGAAGVHASDPRYQVRTQSFRRAETDSRPAYAAGGLWRGRYRGLSDYRCAAGETRWRCAARLRDTLRAAVDQKREVDAGIVAEQARVMGVAQSDGRQVHSLLTESSAVLAQLRDVLAAEDSTIMAKKHHHGRPPLSTMNRAAPNGRLASGSTIGASDSASILLDGRRVGGGCGRRADSDGVGHRRRRICGHVYRHRDRGRASAAGHSFQRTRSRSKPSQCPPWIPASSRTEWYR